ncbi:MAG: hypothetical protein Ta2G_11360 [Termitinemataceae bacterium]|nr:MAG: hypothetical protein Ta2G_11360 [Termitinemataceae bacterium]
MESVLTKALRLAHKKKFLSAQQLLEAEIFRYRDSFNFFYTLGLTYLYSGNYGSAFDHLTSARSISPRNTDVLLAIASIYVKRSDTRNAIKYYLEAQESSPKNKIAIKALKILKKYGASDDLIAWVEGGNLKKLYPAFLSAPINTKKLFALILIILVTSIFTVGILLKTKAIEFNKSEREQRSGLIESSLTKEEKSIPTELGGVYAFILSEKQILDSYNKALELFNENRDNAVRFQLNKIYTSNASEGIKRKADILSSYLNKPSFETLRDNYEYKEVNNDPLLYKNVFVIWSGMATNIETTRESTSFDFLLGYEKRNILLGTAKVDLPFAAEINVEKPIEVLGKIILLPGGGFTIEGSSVHQKP